MLYSDSRSCVAYHKTLLSFFDEFNHITTTTITMSSLTVTNIVSLKSFKPNKSDSSTKSNQVEALKQLDGAKGCKGVVFEGVAREEPDVSVRCIEWDSVEVSRRKVPLESPVLNLYSGV